MLRGGRVGYRVAVALRTPTLTIEDMQALARARGGECRAAAYVNARTPLEWSCADGHVWAARPASVRAGTWCPRCAGRRQTPLAELRALAAARGGACLSEYYANPSTRLRWRCGAGHVWEASATSVRGGSWCPRCKRPSIEECRRLARACGGACLSTSVGHVRDALVWQCGQGHVWTAPLERMRRGTWCRICADASQRGRPRPRISLADAAGLALERGGACLSTEWPGADCPLEWRCARGHVWTALYRNVKRGGWCAACRQEEATAELRALAAGRGGRLVSPGYVQCDVKVEWACAAGHRWSATPHKILRGSWCPECAGNRRGSLAEMQAVAAARGGACLSPRYRNSGARLRWRCARGHEWEAAPVSVKAGRWCPVCAAGRRAAVDEGGARGPAAVVRGEHASAPAG